MTEDKTEESLHDLPVRFAGVAACVLDGLQAKEAASAMGLPLKTYESRLTRLREIAGARNTIHLAAILGAFTAMDQT